MIKRLGKVSLAIVAVVVLLVLAVPLWRGLALSQLRQAIPNRYAQQAVATD